MTITLRQVKGSELTTEELDGNFSDLDLRTAAGWKDYTTAFSSQRVPAQNAPTWAPFNPGAWPEGVVVEELSFAVGNYLPLEHFHINHDVAPGGVALFHCHWTTNSTNTGNVKWAFIFTRARGHQQEAFSTPTVVYVEQAAVGTPYWHMTAEINLTDAITLIEPDELIKVVVKRVAASSNENTDTVFGLTADIHYESDRDATPNRSPDFYA
jgi:hypothetical protein